MPAIALDLDFVRAQFPAFTAPEAANWTHFENAGGSFPASQTIDALTSIYRTKVQLSTPFLRDRPKILNTCLMCPL